MIDIKLLMGAPIILQYTTDQAIEDGVLVHAYPDRFPFLLITLSIHADLEIDIDGRTYDQKLVSLMDDVVYQMEVHKRRVRKSEINYVTLDHTVVGTVWAVPNDKGGITIMKPEDY